MLQKGACFCESFTINDKGFFINSGVANNGMKIDMFLDQSGKIISGGIEMKYRIEEYKLKNGIEDISIIFDEKYQLLTTFMSCDVLPFEKWIKSGFDRVLSGKSEYEEVNGNVCCAEISPKTTKVYDMGNWCEVDTKELRQLIDEWCDKVQKFKMSITTKPPTGRLNS